VADNPGESRPPGRRRGRGVPGQTDKLPGKGATPTVTLMVVGEDASAGTAPATSGTGPVRVKVDAGAKHEERCQASPLLPIQAGELYWGERFTAEQNLLPAVSVRCCSYSTT
jgi:hypothetical protein